MNQKYLGIEKKVRVGYYFGNTQLFFSFLYENIQSSFISAPIKQPLYQNFEEVQN